jgi:ribosome-associated protein
MKQLFIVILGMAKINVSAEIVFKTARSGGKGGQNVNKVETMVEGRFNIRQSGLLTSEEKELLIHKLSNKITGENVLLVKSQEARTQLANKEIVVKKINAIIEKGLLVPKKRKPTRVPMVIKEKRLESKKKNAQLKENRKKITNG